MIINLSDLFLFSSTVYNQNNSPPPYQKDPSSRWPCRLGHATLKLSKPRKHRYVFYSEHICLLLCESYVFHSNWQLSWVLPDYMAQRLKIRWSSYSPPYEPEISLPCVVTFLFRILLLIAQELKIAISITVENYFPLALHTFICYQETGKNLAITINFPASPYYSTT
jgi:hypothetical protein